MGHRMTPTDFIFLFMIRVQFYLFLFFHRSESIRVDPTRTGGPDFCTCLLAKMFVCPGAENITRHDEMVPLSFISR